MMMMMIAMSCIAKKSNLSTTTQSYARWNSQDGS